ncbi:type II toxin-antitoxin system Phd/YefM family antitoxin [Ruminococcaceae bacterium OttesenSCG-928-D13]|nr:type II toxin-antitoxin system Phd/YefM family antitoxin [Ruminococcaceae bacterium OttesenSCG-928-D13]
MYNTYARPSKDLRTHYADVIRDLKEHNQILITNNGRGEAVLIGVDDYAEYEEYLHYRYVKEKLDEAEAAENDPNTKWISKDDFFARARAKL